MQAIILGLTSCFLALIAPGILLSVPQQQKEEPVVLVIEESGSNCDDTLISIACGQEIIEIPLEEYLVGVVLSEMPASFHMEALKAQAVAARTFTMRMLENSKHDNCDLCSDSSCCQMWRDGEAIKEKLGEAWNTYWEKAEEAVSSTRGEVLTFDGELIEAVYFSCSGGSTEAAVAVWGAEVPYLQSVVSDGEEEAARFSSTEQVSITEFQLAVLAEDPAADLSGNCQKWIGEIQRSQGGGVEQIKIGGQWFSGVQIRRMFDLNSTKFSILLNDDEILFEVLGYGHRVGMSQYGANAMAKQGANYQQILAHYYLGTKLLKIK